MLKFAKVTKRGQISVPVAVQKKLRLYAGDSIAFVEVDGGFFVLNADKIGTATILDSYDIRETTLGIDYLSDIRDSVKKAQADLEKRGLPKDLVYIKEKL